MLPPTVRDQSHPRHLRCFRLELRRLVRRRLLWHRQLCRHDRSRHRCHRDLYRQPGSGAHAGSDPGAWAQKEGTPKASSSAPVSGGTASLTIACTGGPFQGTLKLTAKIGGKNVVIGTASYNIAAGKSATVKVKLNGKAKKLLKEGKTVKAKLSGKGLSGTIKLKSAKKKGLK